VNEYEICYKCHGDSANKPQVTGSPAGPYPNRQLPQFNMRLMFNPANPSYHPIAAPGKRASSPSLYNGWTASSVMYCTDCHDNDQGPKAHARFGAVGPARVELQAPAGGALRHGEQQLSRERRRLRAVLQVPQSERHLQRRVVQGPRQAHEGASSSCSICHDPHGISSTQGNATNNSSLMNFDKRFVTPSSGGILRYDNLGGGGARCYLTCHSKNHNPLSY